MIIILKNFIYLFIQLDSISIIYLIYLLTEEEEEDEEEKELKNVCDT